MTSFQIVVIILSALGLLGGIITVYIKTQVDIAKINTTLIFIQKDLDGKEKSILHLEKNNSDDHKEILRKLDLFIQNNNHAKN